MRLIFYILLILSPTLFANVVVQPIPNDIKSTAHLPKLKAHSWVLANYNTGWIIASHDAQKRIEPASLTKLMTSYLIFDAIKNEKLSLDDFVLISKKAWKSVGSRMFIEVDTQVAIRDLIQGLVVQSGNDAAVALAEHLGGSEADFATLMNETAKRLGMENTMFANSSGLPADNHYSTALDLTILSIALIRDFPELYKYYAQLEYTYNNITQRNRNALLGSDDSVDGLKTGYTKDSGYGLIGTANRAEIRYIATLVGAQSKKSRTTQVKSLLEYAYNAYEGLVAFRMGDVVTTVPLLMGEVDLANVGVGRDLSVIYPKGQADNFIAALELPDYIEAPITQVNQTGMIKIKYKGKVVLEQALFPMQDYIEGGGWWSRLIDSIKKLVK